MIYTQTPMQDFNSSYYEQNGFQWNLRGPNFFFNSGQPATSPFGNPDPNAGARGGFGFGGGGLSGSLRFNFAQGSSQSISSTTPSLTTMNGYPGSLTSQTIRPFVTGFTPIVGGYPTTTPGQQMSEAFQQQQASQLTQQRLKAASVKQQKAYQRYRRGLDAEEEGDLKTARANYRLSLGSATGDLRSAVVKRMRANGW
jgi:hypothetical protein